MTKKQSVLNEDLVTELSKNCKTQDDLFGPEGIFKQLMKAVLEKSLNAELSAAILAMKSMSVPISIMPVTEAIPRLLKGNTEKPK